MDAINWPGFFLMLPYCLFGFLCHLLGKLIVAQKRPDFSMKIFINKQWLGWVYAWLLICIAAYFVVRHITINDQPLDIAALSIGLGGGSAGKLIVKITSKKLKS